MSRETEEDFQNWMGGSAKDAHSGERSKPVGTGSGLLEFEVAQQSSPKTE